MPRTPANCSILNTGIPPAFKHEHPPAQNVNDVADDKLTLGQKVADSVASTVGSWKFIIIQSIILLIWLILNSLAWT